MSVQRNASKLYGSSASEAEQRAAFTGGDVPVAVYGLGKMGLPLAAVYAETTGNVIGADVNDEVRAAVNRGECHVKREPGLPALVDDLVSEGALRARRNREAAAAASIHVVIVPTPITEGKEPDLSILDAVMRDVASGLEEGDLVVTECTVPPRTNVDRVLPLLEEESGLELGQFGLAMCPERTKSGRALEDIRGAYPKVVGGVDEESTRVATLVYDELSSNEVIAVSDATTAEAVKVFEGVYRDVNIALANELARYTDELGIDVNEAIDVANTQPYCDIHRPGPGVGGHCIPYYPYFLINGMETESPLLETARRVNDSMPGFTVGKIAEELRAEGKDLADATVLVLGLTYAPGVEEIRASPSIPITHELTERGANVLAVDPMLDETDAFAATRVSLESAYEADVDAIALVTPHEEFEGIDWEAFGEGKVVIDGRRTLDPAALPHRVYTIGSG